MQNPVRLLAVLRGQSKVLYPPGPLWGKKEERAERSRPLHLDILGLFKNFGDWHAPRIKRIILPPKSNIFRSAVPGWLPGTALHFLASGVGCMGEKPPAANGLRPLESLLLKTHRKDLGHTPNPTRPTAAKDLYRPCSRARFQPDSWPRPPSPAGSHRRG